MRCPARACGGALHGIRIGDSAVVVTRSTVRSARELTILSFVFGWLAGYTSKGKYISAGDPIVLFENTDV